MDSIGVSDDSSQRILRVGIIGCGEISQVAHIPNLNSLSHLFQTTYLCDISRDSLAHCARKVTGPAPKTTRDAAELCASPDVDVVLIASADPYHVDQGILALQNDKHCLIEKPASVCFRDMDRLIECEKTSKGRVMVGTMRRFATAFLDAVSEVGGMERIQYARVRDIIGPGPVFVGQSGMFPRYFTDFSEEDNQDRLRRTADMQQQALGHEFGVPVTDASKRMLRPPRTPPKVGGWRVGATPTRIGAGTPARLPAARRLRLNRRAAAPILTSAHPTCLCKLCRCSLPRAGRTGQVLEVTGGARASQVRARENRSADRRCGG